MVLFLQLSLANVSGINLKKDYLPVVEKFFKHNTGKIVVTMPNQRNTGEITDADFRRFASMTQPVSKLLSYLVVILSYKYTFLLEYKPWVYDAC